MQINKRIRESVEQYLDQIEQLNPKVLGSEAIEPSARAGEDLLTRFHATQKLNNLSKLSAILALLATFGLAFYFALHYRDDVRSLLAILGGNLFSLLLIVVWLRRVWLEGATLDILILLIQGMPAKEGANVITTFYFGTLRNPPARSGDRQAATQP